MTEQLRRRLTDTEIRRRVIVCAAAFALVGYVGAEALAPIAIEEGTPPGPESRRELADRENRNAIPREEHALTVWATWEFCALIGVAVGLAIPSARDRRDS